MTTLTQFKDKARKALQKARLLTLLIIVASLAFMVRMGDTVGDIKNMSGAAFAEDKATKDKETASPAKDESKTVEAATEDTQPSSADLKGAEEAAADKAEGGADDLALPSTDAGAAGEKSKWQDASDDDAEYADIKKEMYQDLLRRRQELDDRDKKLSEREALVQVAQKEIDKKYTELEGLRSEIQVLLKKQSEEEQARMASLVKIYAGMKPKDAARIFNTLDLDILIEVVGRMPEGKSSPIIAAMEADRARALTIMLAEQKKLPDLP